MLIIFFVIRPGTCRWSNQNCHLLASGMMFIALWRLAAPVATKREKINLKNNQEKTVVWETYLFCSALAMHI